MTKEIVIKLQVEGIHQWKECDIEEVIFLKNKHRHIFHIEIHKEVKHNERDIEIIKLKRQILKYLRPEPVDFENKSCESIAEDIFNKFQCSYVKVLEDNENGAIIKK